MPQSPADQKAIIQRMIDAGEKEEHIAAVIQHFKTAPAEGPRSTLGDLADVAKGFGKRVGQTGLDLANLRTMVGGETIPTPDWMQPTNRRQQEGMVGFDAASVAAPVMAGARLAPIALRKATPAIANRIERWAVPGLTKEGAEQVLSRGRGRVGGAVGDVNRQALWDEILAEEAVPPNPSGLFKTQPAPARSALRPASWAIKTSVEHAANRLPTTADLLTVLAGGGASYGTKSAIPGMALAAAKVLGKPGPMSATAQALYSAAPAVNAVTGGGAGLVARYLMSLFGEPEDKNR
jgi:hypothetical protein